jgi:hypothetical protein
MNKERERHSMDAAVAVDVTVRGLYLGEGLTLACIGELPA